MDRPASILGLQQVAELAPRLDVSMALVPPSQSELPLWDMTESSPLGSAQGRSEELGGVPIGGKSS
jgi:hypothetical protein